MISSFVLTIAADEELPLHVRGDFVGCLEADLASFRLGFDSAPDVLFAQGLSYRAPEPFKQVRVKNTNTSVALNVTLIVGMGMVEDRRQISSTPQGIDPKTRSDIAARAFIATKSDAAVASNHSAVQLWNPASSGVTLALSRVAVAVDTNASSLVVGFNTSAFPDAAANGLSKLADGDASQAEVRTRTDTTTPTTTAFDQLRLAADAQDVRVYDPPLLLPEGNGVVVHASTQQAGLKTAWQYLELPG